MDKFQRTRGVLQYLAIVIHRLWNSDNRDLLIMPASLPLDDSQVRNKSIHYLPPGWDAVIEKEIDGDRAAPSRIDGQETRFGSLQAARRVARTLFLGSAASIANQINRGIQLDRILLGTVQPGQSIGIFEDALKRLRDQLHHLYADKNRFWFDTKANLRREMESRQQQINDNEIESLIKKRITSLFGRKQKLAGIHVFTNSVDIPDEYIVGLRLVILPLDAAYNKNNQQKMEKKADSILKYRGGQPRQKQNRLIFLAADSGQAMRLTEHAKIYLAWESIEQDIKQEKLNLDLLQVKNVKEDLKNAEKMLNHLMRETYKWLICPVEEIIQNKPVFNWEVISLSTTTNNFIKTIEDKLEEEEYLISTWSHIHLNTVLNQWYFKEQNTEINALKVWQDSFHYLYLPRLLNDSVFQEAINQGIEQKTFGFATGQKEGQYLGFIFGKKTKIHLDESAILIKADAARQYQEQLKATLSPPKKTIHQVQDEKAEPFSLAPSSAPPAKTHFHANVTLNPISPKMDFSKIVEEVIEQLTKSTDVEVTISLEIDANAKEGFDESLERTLKENCHTLKFNLAEFDL
ncbi:AAA family ATPase [Candidatus Thiomargarita nelsonii]|uniref:AAA family ATPase n=1 Tax=Candidatus Thiomargarita nelsonii TaxID=1003181 RepID=A0A176S2Y7_9GAMM|nr:AAA family ATPase [Candidatus Thiomargarita nelsonii]